MNKPSHVASYLRGAIDRFDDMLSNAERLKFATELPIIGAAVAAPLSIAIGNHTDRAIYLAGVGAAGGALSTYLDLRTRAGYVASARSALTCVNREYINQLALARIFDTGRSLAADAGTMDIAAQVHSAAPLVSSDVATAGAVAVAAADDVMSNLKVRLAGLGQAPDYGKILEDLRAKQAAADAKVDQSNKAIALAAGSNAALHAEVAKQLAGYTVRVAECVAKAP